MKLETNGTETVLRIDAAERRLLVWTLKRASFEDTPPEHQREILEFASQLLSELGEGMEASA